MKKVLTMPINVRLNDGGGLEVQIPDEAQALMDSDPVFKQAVEEMIDMFKRARDAFKAGSYADFDEAVCAVAASTGHLAQPGSFPTAPMSETKH